MKIGYFFGYFAVVVISAFASAACESTSNSNMRNVNSNTAVVVNATTSPTPRRTDNANMTREEYDRNRAEYEKDKGSSTIGSGVNDSWLWFKTKTALATTDDLRDSTINVDVVDSKITLKGTVASAAEKASAERVAKGIEGQTGVTNQLQVRAGDSVTNQMVNGSSNRR